MPNAEEFSELIRTGGLDFALLKPIDTQFLVSLQNVDWSTLSNFVFACVVLVFRYCSWTSCRGPCSGALSDLLAVRRGDAVQPDDRAARPACGWGTIRISTTSGSTSPISRRYPMEIYEGPSAPAAVDFYLRGPCWWWSTCRRGCLASRSIHRIGRWPASPFGHRRQPGRLALVIQKRATQLSQASS